MLAAVDKFKGTASAIQVARAIGHACWELGHDGVELPVADGGEGAGVGANINVPLPRGIKRPSRSRLAAAANAAPPSAVGALPNEAAHEEPKKRRRRRKPNARPTEGGAE